MFASCSLLLNRCMQHIIRVTTSSNKMCVCEPFLTQLNAVLFCDSSLVYSRRLCLYKCVDVQRHYSKRKLASQCCHIFYSQSLYTAHSTQHTVYAVNTRRENSLVLCAVHGHGIHHRAWCDVNSEWVVTSLDRMADWFVFMWMWKRLEKRRQPSLKDDDEWERKIVLSMFMFYAMQFIGLLHCNTVGQVHRRHGNVSIRMIVWGAICRNVLWSIGKQVST